VLGQSPVPWRTEGKRILRRHDYPPDKQEKAARTVLDQAEVLSEIWAGA
jgi:type I restriction enzyme R subunit